MRGRTAHQREGEGVAGRRGSRRAMHVQERKGHNAWTQLQVAMHQVSKQGVQASSVISLCQY
jgi:hypothetical protein